MEYFILALIGRMKLTSLYAFRQEAGLQPGGIRSALEHLEKRDFILRAEPGRRMRRDLALTRAGQEFLERSWTNCLREYADAESVMRSAMVSWLMDCQDHAAAYLQVMGDARRIKAIEAERKSEYFKQSQQDPLSSYAWMRISIESNRLKAESEAFFSFSRTLQQRSERN